MDITPFDILLVMAGGAIGAALRFLAGQMIDSDFPWATFAVNVIGAFLLAFLTFAFTGMSDTAKLFLFTGLLGAFTTMSTFTLETTTLFFDGRMWEAGLNVILNVGLCLGGAVLGRYTGLLLVS